MSSNLHSEFQPYSFTEYKTRKSKGIKSQIYSSNKEYSKPKENIGISDMNINNIDADEFNADITSGSMTFSFSRFINSKLEMTSGNMNVTLPSDGGKVTVSKTSGSVSTSRECTISGDLYPFGTSQSKMNINITSGRVALA